jgi:adhesin/invasin
LVSVQGITAPSASADPVWTPVNGLTPVWHIDPAAWDTDSLYIATGPGAIANGNSWLIVDRGVFNGAGELVSSEPVLSLQNNSGVYAYAQNFDTMAVGTDPANPSRLVAYFWDWDGTGTGQITCTGANTVPVTRIYSGQTSNVEFTCVPWRQGITMNSPTGGEVDQLTGKVYLQGGTNTTIDGRAWDNTDANASTTFGLIIWDPITGTQVSSGTGLIQPGTMAERRNLKRSVEYAGGTCRLTASGHVGALGPYTTSDMALDASGNIYMFATSDGSGTNCSHGILLRIVPSRNASTGEIIDGTPANPWKYYVVEHILPESVGDYWGTGGGGMVGSAFFRGDLYVGGYNAMRHGSEAYTIYRSVLKVDPLAATGRPYGLTTGFFYDASIGGTTGVAGRESYDFASAQTAAIIEGVVYNDPSGLGLHPENFTTLAGQTVALYDADNKLISQEETDSEGHYSFMVYSGVEGVDTKYTVRLVQPHINVGTDASPVWLNAIQTWARGGAWQPAGSTYAGELNNVVPQCFYHFNDTVTSPDGTRCSGVQPATLKPDSLDDLGDTRALDDMNIASEVHIITARDVADADFAVTIKNRSWGDAQGTTKTLPSEQGPSTVYIQGAGVVLGGSSNSFEEAVHDPASNAHGDHGVTLKLANGSRLELQDQLFSKQRTYHLTAHAGIDASYPGRTNMDMKVKYWFSGFSTVNIPSTAPATSFTRVVDPWEIYTEYTAPNDSGTMLPGVFRFVVSTANVTRPDNTTNEYWPEWGSAAAETQPWVIDGEVEDYRVFLVSYQVRAAIKVTGGNLANQPYVVTNAVNGGTSNPSTTSGVLTGYNGTPATSASVHAVDSAAAATRITLDPLPTGFDYDSAECYGSTTGFALPVDKFTTGFDGNKPYAEIVAGYFGSAGPDNIIDDLTCQFNVSKSIDPDESSLALSDTYTENGSTTSDGKTGVNSEIEATVTAKAADGTLLPQKVIYFTVPGGTDVTVKDANDTTLTASGGYYTCTTGNDGTCKIKLSSTKAAVYTNGLHALVKVPASNATPNEEVTNSPATIEYVAGSCEAGPTGHSYFDVDATTAEVGSDATDGVTFTINLRDQYDNACQPVSGALTLSKTNSAVIVGPTATATVGTYTARVYDEVAETSDVTLKLNNDNINVSTLPGHVATANPQPIVFTPGPVDTVNSTVTIAPTVTGQPVLANNSDTYTITATVQDEFHNPLARTVTFGVVTGTATLSGTGECTTATTGTNAGKCTVTVQSSTVGTATIAATITEGALTGSPVSATFSPGDPSQTNSEVVITKGNNDTTKAAGPIEAGQAYTVEVTVKDAQGHALDGKAVQFYKGSNTTPETGTYTTGNDGKVTYSWTETVADDPATTGVNEGSHILHAKILVGSTWEDVTYSPLTRVWNSSTQPDASKSYLQIDGNTEAASVSVAGGTHTVKVTLYDQYGNLVSGAPVTFECTSTNCASATIAAASGTSAAGVYYTTVNSFVAGDYSIKAKYGNAGDATATIQVAKLGNDATPAVLTTGDTVVAKFHSTTIDADKSELSVSPVGPLTVGTTSTYTATVTGYDGLGTANGGKGNLVGGQQIKFTLVEVVNGSETAIDTSKTTLSASTCTTESAAGSTFGTCHVEFTSTKAGTFRIKAFTSLDDDIDHADRVFEPGTIDASKSTFDVVNRDAYPKVSNITGVPAGTDTNWWIVRIAAQDEFGNYISDLNTITSSAEFINKADQNSGVYFSSIIKVDANADPDGTGPGTALSYPTFIAYARTTKAGEWSLGARATGGTQAQIGSFIPKKWDPGTVDPNKVSYVLTNNTGVAADGIATQTATITVRDTFDNPIPGHLVKITNVTTGDDNPTKLVFGPSTSGEGATSNETGHVGEYVFTLSSTAARSYDIRGWVQNAAGTDYVSIPITSYTTANPQTTNFVASTCSAPDSLLNVDKTTTAVGTNIAATITLMDAQGNVCTSSGTPALVFEAGSSGTASTITGSGGVYTATVTDTKAESFDLSATLGGTPVGKTQVGTGTVTASPTVELTFTVGEVSLTHSDLTIDSPTYVSADGTGQHVATVTLRDQYGNPEPGKQVTFSLHAALTQKTSGVAADICTSLICTTGADGTAKIVVTSVYSTTYYDSDRKGSFDIGATYLGSTIQNTDTPTRGNTVKANYEQGGASATHSTLTMERDSSAHAVVSVDDVPGYQAKVLVKNDADQIVIGASVVFTLDNGALFGNNQPSYTVVSNDQGYAVVTLYSHVLASGNATTLTATIGGVAVSGSPLHPTFTVGAPFVGQAAENGDPATRVAIDNSDPVAADGTSSHKVTIYAVDRYGNILPNVNVRVSQANADGTAYTGTENVSFSANTGITDITGKVELYVRSTNSGDFYVKAEVVKDQTVTSPDPVTGWQTAYNSPVKAVFSAGLGDTGNSSFTVSPTGPLTVGETSASDYTVTTTVRDANNNLVSGATVTLATDPTTGVSYPNGATCVTSSISGAGFGTCGIAVRSTKAGVFALKPSITAGLIGSENRTWEASTIDASKSSFEVLERSTDPKVSDVTGLPTGTDTDWWIVRLSAQDEYGNYIDDLSAIQSAAEFINKSDQNSGVYFSSMVKIPAGTDPDGSGLGTAVAYPTYIAYARTTKAGEWSLGARATGGTQAQIGSFIPKKWEPTTVDAAHSTYVLTDTADIYANGTATQTATITVRDRFGNPIPGHLVRITNVTTGDDSPTKLVFGPSTSGEGATSNETGHVGEYVFTLASTSARSYSIQAWVRNATGTAWESVPVSTYTTANPQSTHFVAGSCSAANSILAVDKTSATVGTNIAVTISLKDAVGNACNSGTPPALVFESGSSATGSTVTGSAGTYTATVTDTKAESFDLSATIGGTPIGTIKVGSAAATTGTAIELTFTADVVDVTHSSITIDSAEFVSADGSGQHTVTATLRDQYGNPVANAPVAFTLHAALAQKTTGLATGICSSLLCTTGSDGTAKIVVTSVYSATYYNTTTYEGSFEVAAAYQSQAVPNTETPVGYSVLANYKQGGASATHSTLTLERALGSHNPVTVDDVPGYEAKVLVKNAADQVVVGATVVFTIDNGALFGNNLATYSVESNSSGYATVAVYSHVLATGTQTTLTATIGGVEVGSSPVHPTFTVGKPFVGQAAENGDPATRVAIDNDTAVTADGNTTHKVTVYAVDRYGNILPNVDVRLSHVNADGTPYTGTSPITFTSATGTTNTSGLVELYVKSTDSGDFYIKAEVVNDQTVANPDPVTGWQTAYNSPVKAVFGAGAGTTGNSSFTITPPGPLPAGTGSGSEYLVTTTVRDANNNLVPSAVVTLNTSPTTVTFPGSQTCITMATGVCSISVSSTTAGTYALKPTIAAGEIGSENRTWTPGPVDASSSGYVLTNTADVVADGNGTQTATLTVKDAYGNPISGHKVRITNVTTGDASPSKLVLTPASGESVTGSSGTATFSLASTQARTYSIQAWVRNDADTDWISIPVSATTVANPADTSFVSGPISLTHSELEVTPAGPLTVGETSAADYTAKTTVRDQNDNPITGVAVTVSVSPSGPTFPNGATCSTGADGSCSVAVRSTEAGTYTISSAIPLGNVGSASRTWVAGPVDAGSSGYTLTNTANVIADGTGTQTATISVNDAYGNPISGHKVRITNVTTGDASPTKLVLVPANGESVTGSDGTASFSLSSTQARTYSIQAWVRNDADTDWVSIPVSTLTVANPAETSFVSGPISLAHSEFTITPAGPLTVGETAASDYTVTTYVRDVNDNPEAGVTVTITVSPTGPTFPNGATCTTGADGSCSVTTRSTVAGTFAFESAIPLGKVGQPISRVWSPDVVCGADCTPAPGVDNAHRTRLDVTQDNQAANGTARDIVKAYGFDKYGNPVPGATVVTTATDADLILINPTVTLGDDGSVELYYSTLAAKSYQVEATVGGAKPLNSPATITFFDPNPKSAAGITGPEKIEVETDYETAVDIDVLAEYVTTATPLIIASYTQPENGTVTFAPDSTALDVVNAAGMLTYIPNDGYSGVDTFSVTVSNADGTTKTSTVAVTVGEAPLVLTGGDTLTSNWPLAALLATTGLILVGAFRRQRRK